MPVNEMGKLCMKFVIVGLVSSHPSLRVDSRLVKEIGVAAVRPRSQDTQPRLKSKGWTRAFKSMQLAFASQ